MIDDLQNQIATSFQNLDENFTRIDCHDTKDDSIFSVEIPVEKLKSKTIRIIVSKTIIGSQSPETIKTNLNDLIVRKINQSRELFGEFHKIEKGHCAWVL